MKNQDRPWKKIGAFANFGAFTWEFPRGAWEQMGKSFEEKGVTAAQLSGDLLDELLERPEMIPAIREKLAAHGVAVAALGAYRNLVSIHEKRRRDNLAYVERCLEIAGELGNPVGNRTGTRNPQGDWSDDPANHSLPALESLHRALERLVKVAEKSDSILALEGYVNNVVKTTERMEEILQHYHSPNLKVVCDPYNYIYRTYAK
jgi:sugar phosphate isomerase/epimerase